MHFENFILEISLKHFNFKIHFDALENFISKIIFQKKIENFVLKNSFLKFYFRNSRKNFF